jgi:hypothetical protein
LDRSRFILRGPVFRRTFASGAVALLLLRARLILCGRVFRAPIFAPRGVVLLYGFVLSFLTVLFGGKLLVGSGRLPFGRLSPDVFLRPAAAAAPEFHIAPVVVSVLVSACRVSVLRIGAGFYYIRVSANGFVIIHMGCAFRLPYLISSIFLTV